jgi:hypothetical protein
MCCSRVSAIWFSHVAHAAAQVSQSDIVAFLYQHRSALGPLLGSTLEVIGIAQALPEPALCFRETWMGTGAAAQFVPAEQPSPSRAPGGAYGIGGSNPSIVMNEHYMHDTNVPNGAREFLRLLRTFQPSCAPLLLGLCRKLAYSPSR